MSATPSTMPPPAIVIEAAEEFTEFCDRCGAQAKSRFFLTSGGELTFCAHHAREYGGGLAGIVDRLSVEEGFDWTSW